MNECPYIGTDADRANHHWPTARAAALTRDNHRCTICGTDGHPDWEPFARLLLHLIPEPICSSFPVWRERQWPRVWESADRSLRASLRRSYEGHQARLARPHEQVRRELDQALSRFSLEVHHVEPCRGRHGRDGCWHHLSNLRTLCAEDHAALTAGRSRQLLLTG